MDNIVRILASARADTQSAKSAVELLQAELEATDEYQRLQLAKQNLSERTSSERTVYDALYDQAVQNYDGQNKKPHPAVGLGDYTVVEYDEEAMKNWAIDHKLPGLLKLDKRAANAVAKGPTAPEFVTISTEVRARIAADLSEYLDE